MGDNTGIEWTDATWNPVTGCNKVSAGCKNCYAEKMAERLQKMGQANYRNGFEVTLQPHMLDIPKRWTRPRRIFVNSMSDLFHKDVPDEYIKQVFDVMRSCPQHTFQVLTKRIQRLVEYSNRYRGGLYAENVWIGVSVENEEQTARIEHLNDAHCFMKFISAEPLLGQLNLSPAQLEFIDWVIVGGESGPNHRPIQAEWVLDIRDTCTLSNTAFFFKQWGGMRPKSNGSLLNGKEYKEFPTGKKS